MSQAQPSPNYGKGSLSALPPAAGDFNECFLFSPSQNHQVVRASADMLLVNQKCDNIRKYCEDALKKGQMSDMLQEQLLNEFPKLVAAIFGLPSYQQEQYGSSKGWFQQLATVEEYHAMWRLLQSRGAFVRLLTSLRRAPNAPSYVWPINLLPGPTRAVLSRDGRRTSFSAASLRSADPIPSLYNGRINPDGQPGIRVDALEYFIWAFLWAASQSSESGSAHKPELDSKVHYSKKNALYVSTFRQLSLWLLENEAEVQALGSRRSKQSDGGVFTFFCKSVAEFWFNQNPFALFRTVFESGATELRPDEYAGPTFLSINGAFELCSLLIHTTTESIVFSSESGNIRRYDGRGHSFGEEFALNSPITAAADRIAGDCLKNHVLDPLYRFLKLGLELNPEFIPYLAKVWVLILLPFRIRADMETHQKIQKEAAEKLRKKQASASAYHQQPETDTELVLAVLNPFHPASLKSPFIKKKAKGAQKTKRHSARAAGAANAAGLVSAYFTPPKSGSKSKGSSASSSDSEAAGVSKPQNMEWYDFFDVHGSTSATWSKVTWNWWGKSSEDKHRAEEKLLLNSEYRGYIIHSYPLYLPLFRGFLRHFHQLFVERRHPLNELSIRALHMVVLAFYDHALYDLCFELDTTLHKTEASVDSLNINKRWQALERTRYANAGGNTFKDPQLQALVTEVIVWINKFMRFDNASSTASFWASGRGSKYSSVTTMVERMTHCLSWMFKLDRDEVDKLIEQDKLTDNEQDKLARLQRQRHENISAMTQLTMEQRELLAAGRLKLSALDVSYHGVPWDRPITSAECKPLLWLLFKISVVFGLVNPRTREAFVNLRPLGKWWIIYSIIFAVVCFLFLSYVNIDINISLDI